MKNFIKVILGLSLCMALLVGSVQAQTKQPTIFVAPGIDEKSEAVQSIIDSYKDLPVKLISITSEHGAMVTFDIPKDLKRIPLSSEGVESAKLIEQLSALKAPAGPDKWFKHVYPDHGYTIPFSKWVDGYLYAGELNKMEYHHAENGVAYYSYGAWLRGYDPEQVKPYSSENGNK